MDRREQIRIKPNGCRGQLCLRGTRVMVSVILDNLAEGESRASIMGGERRTDEDIPTAIAFAADLAADRHVPPECPPVDAEASRLECPIR